MVHSLLGILSLFLTQITNESETSVNNLCILNVLSFLIFDTIPLKNIKKEHLQKNKKFIFMIFFSTGRNIPDLEEILNTIRQAWNTPNNRSLLQR